MTQVFKVVSGVVVLLAAFVAIIEFLLPALEWSKEVDRKIETAASEIQEIENILVSSVEGEGADTHEIALLRAEIKAIKDELHNATTESSGAIKLDVSRLQQEVKVLEGRLTALESSDAKYQPSTALPEALANLMPPPPGIEAFSKGRETDGCLVFPNQPMEVPFEVFAGLDWCEESGRKVQYVRQLLKNGTLILNSDSNNYDHGSLDCGEACEFVGPHSRNYTFRLTHLNKSTTGSVRSFSGVLTIE